MLPHATDHSDLTARFMWNIPEFYNIGVDVCDRWAERDPDRLALIHVDERGHERRFSFADLKSWSNRLANLLVGLGLRPGERVGILLPQAPETAFGHIAVLKAGAISMPLFALFGPEALAYRLENSGARLVITNRAGAAKLAPLRSALPDLSHILTIDGAVDGGIDLAAALAAEKEAFTPIATRADDPAILIYTSGTTGQPKGALHAHRALLGHLPGVEISHDFFPSRGDRIWTPADWAWIGGLLDVLMPALHHGVTVVARRFTKFTGEAAFQLLQDYAIRNAFIPPTALKTMRAASNPERRWRLKIRSIASGGETLGSGLIEWGRRAFGVTINEFYGQTECNMIVSSCAALMPARPGVMGKPVPGHRLAVLDAQGRELPPGQWGTIAVRRPDPVMFLGYWNDPAATAAKFIGDWLLTGDTGQWEEGGWLRFVGREDDVITSSGYRIGPGEIEDCLLSHPAVRMAAVTGQPDLERTEIVKAFIILEDGHAPSQALAGEIQDFVKTRLAAHEYPRIVAFVDSLPMTATGKIIRKALR